MGSPEDDAHAQTIFAHVDDPGIVLSRGDPYAEAGFAAEIDRITAAAIASPALAGAAAAEQAAHPDGAETSALEAFYDRVGGIGPEPDGAQAITNHEDQGEQ